MAESNKAVFISYAKQDAEAALRICGALRAAGIEVWFDQSELRGGDAWDAAIRRQIKSCALMIPVISANTRGVRGRFAGSARVVPCIRDKPLPPDRLLGLIGRKGSLNLCADLNSLTLVSPRA